MENIRIIFRHVSGAVQQLEQLNERYRSFFASHQAWSETYKEMFEMFDEYDRLIKHKNWTLEKSNVTAEELFNIALSYC